jgi:predicted HAD superfamily Cof-like phosphohydrolase
MKKSSIELVREFHETFDHPVSEKMIIPDQKTVDFRINFMKEELDELEEAVAQNDVVGIMDALGDIQYVLDGFFLNCGLHVVKDQILEEIHRSNMTKACKSPDDALKTMDHLYNQGIETYSEQKGEHYIIKRSSDGKIMKALDYSPVNLKQFLK